MPSDPYLEQRILSADPIELIQILYEHALKSVEEARGALAAGDIPARSKAISRAIGILGELQGSLDKKSGGAISQNLEALYGYMRTRLTVANLKQEEGPLAEVQSLIETLAGAWKGVQPVAIAEPVHPAPAPVREAFAEGNTAHFLSEANSSCADHGWTA
ncbi:MAG TPA: flagellar export chaperone FliS [Bryobacteraceae bacterium]|nr:flagellar export chaperone FliS [Bryobacteraceae bacterium]